MKDIHFKVWNLKENKMYYRGYNKWFYVILCEDDHGENDGKGTPVRRAPYSECVFLESTGLRDNKGVEVFEGDIVKVSYPGSRQAPPAEFTDVVPPVPDTFGAGKMHPLQPLLKKHGIPLNPENLEIEVIGNEYEAH